MTPNKPDAANPAMALGLTIGGQCRVADLGRSASSIQNPKFKIQNFLTSPARAESSSSR